MIAIDQIRVELDVGVSSGLHAGVGLFTWRCGGDFSKERTSRQVNERVGAAAEGLCAAIDVEPIGMAWRWKDRCAQS